MTCFLKNRWLTLATSLVLGGFFISAALSHKISDPPDFAKAVFNYKILPWYLINIFAIYLPWVELIAGAAVLSGIWRRGGTLALAILCAVFIAALSYNLYRGHPTICGCFNTYEEGLKWTDEVKFAKMRAEILLDAGLLVLAAQILYATCATRRAVAPASRDAPAALPRQ
jgi:uncharacterized membrane protein YphA (DoxX/SURF4 family)